MVLGGLGADAQATGDFLGRQAVGDQVEDFALAWGQVAIRVLQYALGLLKLRREHAAGLGAEMALAARDGAAGDGAHKVPKQRGRNPRIEQDWHRPTGQLDRVQAADGALAGARANIFGAFNIGQIAGGVPGIIALHVAAGAGDQTLDIAGDVSITARGSSTILALDESSVTASSTGVNVASAKAITA